MDISALQFMNNVEGTKRISSSTGTPSGVGTTTKGPTEAKDV
jgi:hypothetical protein